MIVWIVTEHFGSNDGVFRSVHATSALAYKAIDGSQPGDYEANGHYIEEETPEPTL